MHYTIHLYDLRAVVCDPRRCMTQEIRAQSLLELIERAAALLPPRQRHALLHWADEHRVFLELVAADHSLRLR
jgi:hypothetical protein